MTYNTVANLCQVVSLLMFIGMFLAVLAYALKPSNRARFDDAQRSALNLDHTRPEDSTS